MNSTNTGEIQTLDPTDNMYTYIFLFMILFG